ESVNKAIEHAKIAAFSLVGKPEAYAGIPWFWSNQGDLKLQIAGFTLGYDHTVVRADEKKNKFSVLYYRDGQIVAADCINAPLDFMTVRSALAKDQNIPAELAADPAQQLKKLAGNVEVASRAVPICLHGSKQPRRSPLMLPARRLLRRPTRCAPSRRRARLTPPRSVTPRPRALTGYGKQSSPRPAPVRMMCTCPSSRL